MEEEYIVIEENALMGDNLDEDDAFAIAAESAGMGQSSEVTTDGETGQVMRYNDPEVLKKHIREVMKIGREKTTFKAWLPDGDSQIFRSHVFGLVINRKGFGRNRKS